MAEPKVLKTRTVDHSLCGRDDGDGIVLGEAFEDGFRVSFFAEVRRAVSSEQKKMSTSGRIC